MSINWPRHFNAIYRRHATDALIIPAGHSGEPVPLRVIDRVRPQTISGAYHTDIHSETVACKARKAELDEKEIALESLDQAVISFNTRTWRIESYHLESPDGPETGEVWMILQEASEDEGS
jgi:hypothetical protein